MHPAVLPAALVLSLSFAMALYVASHRDKAELHWQLMGALGSLMIWTLGTVFRFTVQTQEGLEASLRLLFLGVVLTPAFWLMLAACYARLGVSRRVWFRVACVAPAVAAYLLVLTNGGHHWMIRELSFRALESGGSAWAGPLFYVFLAWAWGCLLGGIVIYLGTAGRMVVREERLRGGLLAVASAVPLLVSPLYMFGLLPVSFDLTPSSLAVSLLLMSVTVFRYRLLDSLPLARRDVIEHLTDGVVMASATGVVLDLNPAAESILGGGPLLRRQPLAEVLAAHACEEDRMLVASSLADLGRRDEPLELEYRSIDDRRIALCAAPVAGQLGGQYALLRDRTDERRFERMLRHTQRMQTAGTLLAGVAHEVNNPLAFIRANLSELHRLGELVESRRAGPDGEGSASDAKLLHELADLREIADDTLDGIGRIERIVGDLRSLAAEQEQQQLDDDPLEAVDLNTAVRDAIRLANLNRQTHTEVRLLLSDDLPTVPGRSERLVQALLNLLLNARHAVEGIRPARISVTTEREGDGVLIRVSDNGPGVSPQVAEQIFDPFFTTKGPDGGTGLGLSIAFDVAREHGGVLEVLSRPGRGAAFVIRIPLAGVPESS